MNKLKLHWNYGKIVDTSFQLKFHLSIPSLSVKLRSAKPQ